MRRVFGFGAILLAAAMAPAVVFGSNQEVAEEIAGVLEESNLIEGCDIGLKYQDETVWLTGVVDSAEKIDAIQAEIKKLDGVSKIVNELEVEKTAVTDNSVQQVAGFQRTIVQNPAQLNDLSNEQIISDEVVAVNGVPVNQKKQPTPAPVQTSSKSILTSAAPVSNSADAVQVMPAASSDEVVISGASAASTPRPIQANYGTTVKPVAYGSTTTMAAPAPMNPQAYSMPANGGAAMRYDEPYMPRKAWPSYASYPNTAAVQYPKRHSPGAWPYVGPYYPYPQVPDGWRKVTLEWHDGYWHLDFDDGTTKGPFNGLFRQKP